jgi:hypothetical protein
MQRRSNAMGRINFSRVVLGGVLAGIIINVSEYMLHDVVLKAQYEDAMKSLGKPLPAGGGVMAAWIVWCFAAGIASVWLYAAIRPRYKAGPATAARAGVAVWFFTWLLSTVAAHNMGILPIALPALAWTLAECVVASVAGAWLYLEREV